MPHAYPRFASNMSWGVMVYVAAEDQV